MLAILAVGFVVPRHLPDTFAPASQPPGWLLAARSELTETRERKTYPH